MNIVTYGHEDLKDVTALFCLNQRIYKPLLPEQFQITFIDPLESVIKFNKVAKVKDEVIGFINGCYHETKDTAYVTLVLVKEAYRRQGIGSALLKQLEDEFKAISTIKKIDLVFFNPINLIWTVPNALGVEHPNAPGVDVQSEGYLFFKNQGYKDFAMQNSYYQALNQFSYPNLVSDKKETLAQQSLTVTYYDPQLHGSFDELLRDLNTPLWTKEITENLAKDKSDPMLIVQHHGDVRGFAGPLRVQQSGRGYFCGIGIHSDYRKYGLGKVLFFELCQGLKEVGADYMTLFTGESNPARNIYELANFKIVKTWANMRKELS